MGVTAVVIAGAGLAYSVYSGEEAKKDRKDMAAKQEAANQQTIAETKKQTETSQQEINRANQRRPDTQAAMANAEMATGGGSSGTMLTGPQGIDPQQLALGKNTLLGG